MVRVTAQARRKAWVEGARNYLNGGTFTMNPYPTFTPTTYSPNHEEQKERLCAFWWAMGYWWAVQDCKKFRGTI